MNIQSLSIVVPTGECWNHCKFCVSRMHKEEYGADLNYENGIPRPYLNRMEYVRDEGCNTMIITGTAEPQQNLPFVYSLLQANQKLRKPFYNIAIQTTGTALTKEKISLLAQNGITTLALSVSSFDDDRNWEIISAPIKVRTLGLEELINEAKVNHLNVRMCINLTSEFNSYDPEAMFHYAQSLEIDQLTFRKIYADGNGQEAEWVKNHEYPDIKFNEIRDYIRKNGFPITKLPYGFIQYSVNGISTVIDDNCMAKDNVNEMKYAILRPNGKLYSRWDDTGSLIF